MIKTIRVQLVSRVNVYFLRSNDEAPEMIKKFITRIQGRDPNVSTSDDFVAPDTPYDTSSSTTIIIDADEAPYIIFTSTKQTPSQSIDIADGSQQEDNAELDRNEFINPFSTSELEEAESSLRNLNLPNMLMFYQPLPFEHQWIKAHLLERILGDPSKPVMTRSKLSTDAKMYVYAFTEGIDFEESFAPVARLEAV
ncbi:hypothetical protein Tco_0769996 [Tanacetum coccineum]|uniref:Reverse transcriptase Ty1/copia-type domain-containing protein n=1 Tax=Tanacetum coccineum TaxID=301880 RepID=A0ABQ4ZB86_9ASTR